MAVFSDYFGVAHNSQDFNAISVSLASPEKIREWSYGALKKPDTINYRTGKPENGGLFCARIFGPVRDYECLCGKYKRMKYRGVTCEKCGVEVISSKERRHRMAHIDLAAPVAHIWFLKSLPSRISIILGIGLKDLEKVLYFSHYIVSDPGLTPLTYGRILSESDYQDALSLYGEGTFEVGMGAETVKKLLMELDLEDISKSLRELLSSTSSEAKRKKIVRRLKLIEDLLEADNKPEWMILDVLPVMPPELRPLVMLDGGRFATSDLNELYRRVINRNNRLKKLMELQAPDLIVKNEKRMLQEAVDALLDNSKVKAFQRNGKRSLKSLSDMLKGKQGRFRQNLLGKRVDYSGRSVITVGPELKLHQCGLPKVMALELYKPFVIASLINKGIASTIKSARRMIERCEPDVWDVLAGVVQDHPVILNRAPTLHRLGIQAFDPILVDGNAIRLHPLVCTAFNADFDGDQMAVHLPLSLESQIEAKTLMMSVKNILSPANGKPIIVPTQDMILGLYYLTLEMDGEPGEGSSFANIYEVEHALEAGLVSLQSKIKCKYESCDLDGNSVTLTVNTTPGRMIFASLLPKHKEIRLDMVSKPMNKKEISNLIETVYIHCGGEETVKLADKIMSLGFHYACRSGVSLGKNDIVVPETKSKHLDEASREVMEYESQYSDGLITSKERYNKVVDTWSRCTESIGQDVSSAMSDTVSVSSTNDRKGYNSIFMMADSGARGSAAQLRQLAGMRGMMAKSSGEIIPIPIKSNFKEGLNVLEYFTSTHGTRKGLADIALKTANSGYLTRKLVDVAQDVIVNQEDCGTTEGIIIEPVIENGTVVIPLHERLIGRVLAADIVNSVTGKIVARTGDLATSSLIEDIEEAGVERVKVRSPILCQLHRGICAKCYGADLSTNAMVSCGESVGIIAAQSIGEPGTQLTMRTFHVGGAAQKSSMNSNSVASHAGTLRFLHLNFVTNSEGQKIIMSHNCTAVIIDKSGYERFRSKIPYGATLLIENNKNIEAGDAIAEWDPFTIPLITEVNGEVSFHDMIKDVSIKEVIDEVTGIGSLTVADPRYASRRNESTAALKPRIVLKGEDGQIIKNAVGSEINYFVPVGAILSVKEGESVHAGDIIARIPRESSKTRDITGGLPRVIELFEARQPKEHSLISEIAGKFEFGKDYKSKRRLIVKSEGKSGRTVEYFVPRGRHIIVRDGDYVNKGDMLMDGTPSPHEILRIMGIEALAHYIVSEVQQVYRLQGVTIHDHHIEVIIRQMLKKVEVTEPGGTTFLLGEQVDLDEFEKVNEKTVRMGYKPATAQPILQGITKASLQTKSFLSAASFQETTKVLTDAAISGKLDELVGLKENVIVGRLIPSGTGYYNDQLRNAAKHEIDVMESAESKDAAEI